MPRRQRKSKYWRRKKKCWKRNIMMCWIRTARSTTRPSKKQVAENCNQYRTCWFHYPDLLHLCNGKFMDTQEPINHTKLLRKSGFNCKHFR
jgi:hypothetical protein